MINNDKWINSLPKINSKQPQEVLSIDHNKWLDTIPKKNTYSSVKKYSAITVLFIIGLLLIPIVKNETRNLEKEIAELKKSIYEYKYNLHQATLDHEVITSPENISLLANEHLESDFVYYKKNQIKDLNNSEENLAQLKDTNTNIKKKKTLSDEAKKQIRNEINKKKQDLAKLKKIYSEPKELTKEVKIELAKKIKLAQKELTFLYNEPGAVIKSEKAQRWAVLQVVKVFLGIPIVPGK
jgi:uncharacterized protein YacL (UPF0231 family)